MQGDNNLKNRYLMIPVPLDDIIDSGIDFGGVIQTSAADGRIIIENAGIQDYQCDEDCENCPFFEQECDENCDGCPCCCSECGECIRDEVTECMDGDEYDE